MDLLSNTTRRSSEDPTPAELEAGACLPRDPEPLESRATDAPPMSTPAVKALVDKHPPPGTAPPRSEPRVTAHTPHRAHPGFALGIGLNAALPGKFGAHGGSVGVVVDLGEPKISVFSSDGSGKATGSAISAGVSAQVSLIADVRKFWGTGGELGVNGSKLGAALNFSSAAPGEPLELNGVTGSIGAGVGVDAHYYYTKTQGGGLSEFKGAVDRAGGLPGLRRFGP